MPEATNSILTVKTLGWTTKPSSFTVLSRIVLSPLEISNMAVAAAASQHHAVSSVLRIPPLPSIRVSHTIARLSIACPPPFVSFSLPLVPIRMFSVYGLSILPRSRTSSSPHSRSCVYLRITPSLRDYLPSAFAFFSFSFSFFRFFALLLLMEKDRKDEENGRRPSSSSGEPSFLSFFLFKCSPKEDGESGRL